MPALLLLILASANADPGATGGDITPTVSGDAPKESATPAPASSPASSPASPPAPAPAPAPPPTPGVGLSLSPDDAFTIHDQTGRRYTTLQFARIIGDSTTLTELEVDKNRARVGTASLAGTGALVVLSSLLVATNNSGAPESDAYMPDPALYDSEKEYIAASEFGYQQYDKATEAWNEQRLGTAVFLAGTGGILLVLAPFFGRDVLLREETPHRAYSRERAQGWIDQYNTAHPVPPPVVQLTPVLGPTMAGVSGTF